MQSLSALLKLLQHPTLQGNGVISDAYYFAKKVYAEKIHYGKRTYFEHAFETAKILAMLGLGPATIATGLLQGIFENNSFDETKLELRFERKIVYFLKCLTRITKVRYSLEHVQTESYAKFFLTNANDVRVLFIKLASQLDTLRHATHMPSKERVAAAHETMNIYRPLAEHLGIYEIKIELENLAFEIMDPKMFTYMENLLSIKTKLEKNRLASFKKSVLKKLAKNNIKVQGAVFRLKGIYSTYRKLKHKGNIDRIRDIKALRLIFQSVEDCYRALGVIHSHWKPLPDRMKDYVAFPKPDGYRSIHTTLSMNDGRIIEVQIRTQEMHAHAEREIKSHTNYKPDEKNILGKWFDYFLPMPSNVTDVHENERDKKVPTWVKKVVDVKSFVSPVIDKPDQRYFNFFQQYMFVFNGRNEVIELPKGASIIDFAFSLEPDKAMHLAGAKINGKYESFDTTLRNGDKVDIETSRSSSPKLKWLQYALTPVAREKIGQYFTR